MRLSADSPLIDYKLINKAIILHKKNMKNFDVIANLLPYKNINHAKGL